MNLLITAALVTLGAHPVTVACAAESGNEPVVRAVGIGQPPAHMSGPQARLMARRAAEVRATRNLATRSAAGSYSRCSNRARSSAHVVRGHRYVRYRSLPDGMQLVVAELPARPACEARTRCVRTERKVVRSGRQVTVTTTTVTRYGP